MTRRARVGFGPAKALSDYSPRSCSPDISIGPVAPAVARGRRGRGTPARLEAAVERGLGIMRLVLFFDGDSRIPDELRLRRLGAYPQAPTIG